MTDGTGKQNWYTAKDTAGRYLYYFTRSLELFLGNQWSHKGTSKEQ